MRHLFFILIGILLLASCQENERMVYGEKPAVYFPDYETGADSLQYSFRIKAQDRDTIYISVKLLGDLLDAPASYRVVALDNSTAIAGEHYEELPESFEFKENTSVEEFPVIVTNPGEEMDTTTVTLELALEATEDLDLGYPDQVKMRLMITNQLIKPSYWDMPLSLYFGEYSQVKHQQCILIMGHDFPLTDDELLDWGGLSGYNYWMQQGRAVCEYYATHTVYDENGNLITVWNPF